MEMKEKRRAVLAPTKRVSDILNFLAMEGRGCTLSEISRGVNSPVCTCSVILRTLVQENFLECSEPAHLYSLGFGVYALSSAFMAPRTVLRSVLSEMHRVVDACGEICELGILDGQDVFYIAKVESQDPIRIVSQVGMRLPACCTATGKALLADFSDEDLHRLYGDTLPTVTAHSLTSFAELAAQLQAIVGAKRFFAGDAVKDDFSHDEMPIYGKYYPEVVCEAESTEEVSAILRVCYDNNIPVTPRGAGTGLVGGCVPLCGGVVLCTTRMNKILSYDMNNLVVHIQPGVLLCDLAADALAHGLMYPPAPGAKTATVGGDVSTNAGGERAVKNGEAGG